MLVTDEGDEAVLGYGADDAAVGAGDGDRVRDARADGAQVGEGVSALTVGQPQVPAWGRAGPVVVITASAVSTRERSTSWTKEAT